MKNKFIAIIALLAWLIGSNAFASVAWKTSGGDSQQVTTVDSYGCSESFDGSVLTHDCRTASLTTLSVSGNSTLGDATTDTTTINGTAIVGTLYARLPYYAGTARPASGAPAGSMIVIGTSSDTNCGAVGGTVYNVCVSDGTNWKDV